MSSPGPNFPFATSLGSNKCDRGVPGFWCDRRCSRRRALARSEIDSNSPHGSDTNSVLASLRKSADFSAMMTTLKTAQ